MLRFHEKNHVVLKLTDEKWQGKKVNEKFVNWQCELICDWIISEKCTKCPYDSTCYRGQCKCPKDCPSDYKPMCGTDGRTVSKGEFWSLISR